MGDPVEAAAEEPAPPERAPAAPSGGSGNQVRRVAASSSVGWERAGREEATAPGRGGECSLRGPRRRPPSLARPRARERMTAFESLAGQHVLTKGTPG